MTMIMREERSERRKEKRMSREINEVTVLISVSRCEKWTGERGRGRVNKWESEWERKGESEWERKGEVRNSKREPSATGCCALSSLILSHLSLNSFFPSFLLFYTPLSTELSKKLWIVFGAEFLSNRIR